MLTNLHARPFIFAEDSVLTCWQYCAHTYINKYTQREARTNLKHHFEVIMQTQKIYLIKADFSVSGMDASDLLL